MLASSTIFSGHTVTSFSKDDVKLKNVVVGDGSVIGKNSTIEDATVWDGVIIGEKCVINNAVICSKNTIGKKVKVSKGVIMAEGCEIGDMASFENDVTVWPEKIVEEASIVSNNIVWGNKYKNSIFVEWESWKVVEL